MSVSHTIDSTYDFIQQSIPLHIDNIKNIFDDSIGISRKSIISKCQQYDLGYTEFAHWLVIPQLGFMFIFKHQNCVNRLLME